MHRRDEMPVSGQAARGLPRWIAAAALALMGGALGLGWWWDQTAEGRAIRALPATERAAFFQRTRADVREVCEPAPPRSLRPLCRENALRLIEFPECDARCRDLALRMLDTPSR